MTNAIAPSWWLISTERRGTGSSSCKYYRNASKGSSWVNTSCRAGLMSWRLMLKKSNMREAWSLTWRLSLKCNSSRKTMWESWKWRRKSSKHWKNCRNAGSNSCNPYSNHTSTDRKWKPIKYIAKQRLYRKWKAWKLNSSIDFRTLKSVKQRCSATWRRRSKIHTCHIRSAWTLNKGKMKKFAETISCRPLWRICRSSWIKVESRCH